MPKVTINGTELEVPQGTPVIRAAAMLGIHIPHFCYHPALTSPANCRMCLVEIERARKLEPACYSKVSDGMVVHTESEKVITARRSVLEFILVNHPVDCPICDQAGECKLQDYYMAYDAKPSRVGTPKVGKVKVHPIGQHVVYDGERCILCTRCVRFCDEITGTSELTVAQRGDRSEIRTFEGIELNNPYSMNVVDICPVGALTSRDFRFKCRVWLLESTDSVCTGCSRGCNIHLEHFEGEVQRYRPRFNPDVNEYWMCDVGRLSYKDLHADRIETVRLDDNVTIKWPRAARGVARRLNDAGFASNQVALVVSAEASNESLYAAKAFADELLKPGHTFWSGKADGDSDAFLVRADKNPNRYGVQAIFGDEIVGNDCDALLDALESGDIKVLYMMGASLTLTGDDRARFASLVGELPLFVLQSAHAGDLASKATIVLPSATHAEQDGSFINGDGIVQPFGKAFVAHGQSLPDWEIFARIAKGADAPLAFADFNGIQAALYAEGVDDAAE